MEDISHGFEQYVAYKKQLPADQRRRLTMVALTSGKFVGQELIGRLPIDEVLTPMEQAILHSELQRPAEPSSAVRHREFVAITKLTRLCNLRCSYCHSWDEGPNQTMKWQTMIRLVRNIVEMKGVECIQFAWHGGEITLLKPKVMKKLIWLQQHLKRDGQHISNSVQTNATCLTDEWVDFLLGLDVQVGFSLDGPPEINDARRLDINGNGTSSAILEGVRRLRDAGIPCGALLVVDHAVIRFGASQIVDFAIDNAIDSVTLLNVLPRNDAKAGYRGEDYLPYHEYVDFLKDVFEHWWPNYRSRVMFTDLVELMKGVSGKGRPGGCLWAGDCHGRFMTVEANGDLAPCDKYRGDIGSVIGNASLHSPERLIRKSTYIRAARSDAQAGTEEMGMCKWFGVCRGGCPHDRMLSMKHIEDHDGACCGLRPLLDSMELAHKETNNARAKQMAEMSLSVI